MLKRLIREKGIYYLGLVFLTFPISGTLMGYYPLWTLSLTAVYALAYLAMIHAPNSQKLLICFAWFYTLFYVLFMGLAYEGAMMWFLFYHVNLLVWRFGDPMRSYRFLSFLATTILFTGVGLFFAEDQASRMMAMVIEIFILGMYVFQRRLRIQYELEKEVTEQHRTINILSAENERNRIGRDLHDTLGHTFAMMTLKTELATKLLEKGAYDQVKKELEELHQISQKSMQEVRTIINNLKYRTLTEELQEIQGLFDLSGITLSVDLPIDTTSLSPVVQSTLTMALRELANNVVKHAKASQVSICLTRQGQTISLNMEDDGCGFEELTGQELHSIRERMALVDGQVEILSLKQPTQIQVTLSEGGKS